MAWKNFWLTIASLFVMVSRVLVLCISYFDLNFLCTIHSHVSCLDLATAPPDFDLNRTSWSEDLESRRERQRSTAGIDEHYAAYSMNDLLDSFVVSGLLLVFSIE